MDNALSPIHPGEVLLEDFMKPFGLTQFRLAHDIGVTPNRISQIVNSRRSISIVPDSTASASTSSGGSAFNGETGMPMRSKSWIITRR